MDTANFSQQLRALPTLVKTLAEDHTYKIKLSPAGHLSVLRGTRWSTAKTPLDIDAVQSLAGEVVATPEKAVLGPWFLCAIRGGDGLTIFGERRIELPDESVPDEVREELLHLTRTGSTGLIAGGVGSSKTSMLLWLATQLGRRELVFVSDVPPRELPAPTATHVFPPANGRERRDLERLLRAHDCIFWDRISCGEDLVSFTSTPDTHNRWFSIDAGSPATLARRLRTLALSVRRLRLDSCMFIEVDADAESRISSLCRHEDGGWTELLSTGPRLTKVLGRLEDVLSVPKPDDAARGRVSSARRRRPSPQAGIISPKRVGGSRSTGRSSDADNSSGADMPLDASALSTANKLSRADEPPEEPTVDSKIEPLGEDAIEELGEDSIEELSEDSIEEISEAAPVSHAREPDGLEGMSVEELKKSAEIDEEELLRQSGEIDLQAFVEARNARRRALQAESETAERAALELSIDPISDAFETPPPGISSEQSSEHADTNVADGAKVDAMLAKMAESDSDEKSPQLAGVAHDKLSPPVQDEITALTAVDMERIRESADDDLGWLLRDDDDSTSEAGDQTLSDAKLPKEIHEHNTRPAAPIWDADPAPTDEISQHQVQERQEDWSEPDDA